MKTVMSIVAFKKVLLIIPEILLGTFIYFGFGSIEALIVTVTAAIRFIFLIFIFNPKKENWNSLFVKMRFVISFILFYFYLLIVAIFGIAHNACLMYVYLQSVD